MGLYVACSSCHETYPAETHAGLIRCADCEERAGPRIDSSPGHVVNFDAWA